MAGSDHAGALPFDEDAERVAVAGEHGRNDGVIIGDRKPRLVTVERGRRLTSWSDVDHGRRHGVRSPMVHGPGAMRRNGMPVRD